jgi:hypothetical protein
MGEPLGAINQGRLCDLWSVSLVPDAELAHPWTEFRAEWEAWLERVSPLVTPDDPHDSLLTWEVVATDGDVRTVQLSIRGEVVAELIVAALPDWPDADIPGVVPFWGVLDYRLS